MQSKQKSINPKSKSIVSIYCSTGRTHQFESPLAAHELEDLLSGTGYNPAETTKVRLESLSNIGEPLDLNGKIISMEVFYIELSSIQSYCITSIYTQNIIAPHH